MVLMQAALLGHIECPRPVKCIQNSHSVTSVSGTSLRFFCNSCVMKKLQTRGQQSRSASEVFLMVFNELSYVELTSGANSHSLRTPLSETEARRCSYCTHHGCVVPQIAQWEGTVKSVCEIIVNP